jgi:hypothetical protein
MGSSPGADLIASGPDFSALVLAPSVDLVAKVPFAQMIEQARHIAERGVPQHRAEGLVRLLVRCVAGRVPDRVKEAHREILDRVGLAISQINAT